MFKLGVVILGHVNFYNIQKLVNDLKHDNIYVYIHIDKNNEELFGKVKLLSSQNIKVFSKYKCKWGNFSLVSALVYCMRKIQKDNLDYLTVISGEDVLLKKASQVYDFFKTQKNYNFLDYRKLSGNDFWSYKLLHLNNYFLFLNGKIFTLPIKRKSYIPLFYSSQWININKEALKLIIDYTDNNPRILRFFRFSFSPDNFFFATIISQTMGFENCINHNLRYIKWKDDNLNKNVKIYTSFGAYFHPRTPVIITNISVDSKNFSQRHLFGRKCKK